MVLPFADLIDDAMKLAGIWATCSALGGTIGVTAAMLDRRPVREAELWGLQGTAVGCVIGALVMICIAAIYSRL